MKKQPKKPYIKAIPTVYKGHPFRSRTEARWAVFFDTLGVQWQYETEGYELGLSKTWYLPDFYMPTWDKYVEVKPLRPPTKDELEKAGLLVQYSGKSVLTLIGQPWPGDYRTLLIIPSTAPAVVAPYTAAIIPYELTGQLGYAAHSNRAYLHYMNDNLTLPLIGLELELVSDNNTIKMITNEKNFDDFSEDVRTGIHVIEGSMNSVEQVLASDTRLSRAYIAARQARFEHGENG